IPKVEFAPVRLTGIKAGTLDLVIRVDAPEWIHGRVLGFEQLPVADAYVTATYRKSKLTSSMFTELDGRFEIPVPRGESVDVRAQPPESAPSYDLSKPRLLPDEVTGVVADDTEIILRLAQP